MSDMIWLTWPFIHPLLSAIGSHDTVSAYCVIWGLTAKQAYFRCLSVIFSPPCSLPGSRAVNSCQRRSRSRISVCQTISTDRQNPVIKRSCSSKSLIHVIIHSAVFCRWQTRSGYSLLWRPVRQLHVGKWHMHQEKEKPGSVPASTPIGRDAGKPPGFSYVCLIFPSAASDLLSHEAHI